MKKTALLLLLAVLGSVRVSLFLSSTFYESAGRESAGLEDKVRLLERATAFNPLDDSAYFELGKAFFEAGLDNLGNPKLRDDNLRKSLAALLKSLRLNPGSLPGHFYLAQSLLNMSYLSLPAPVSYFEEYKKAALLTGHNSQIFLEVGKILLSRWGGLAASEREFTLDILRKLLAGKNQERLLTILRVWELNIMDPEVMDRILPEDPASFRTYASYLGERSLFLQKRQDMLARAEHLDFLRARQGAEQAQRELGYYQAEAASRLWASCLASLEGIHFYQDLAGRSLISPADYLELKKTTLLGLGKSQIEAGGNLRDAEANLRAYLAVEEDPLAVADLERDLRERGLLGEASGDDFRDLKTLALKLLLDFKQNRYREITRIGDLMERSLLVVPEAMKKDYLDVLRTIGDSFQKLDFIYESERFYLKALDLSPNDLETLLRLRRTYERANNEEKLASIDRSQPQILSPVSLLSRPVPLRKGESFPVDVVCGGDRLDVSLEFENVRSEPPTLVSVFFNGKVVWESFAGQKPCVFTVETRVGGNSLLVIVQNGVLTLAGVHQAPAAKAGQPSSPRI